MKTRKEIEDFAKRVWYDITDDNMQLRGDPTGTITRMIEDFFGSTHTEHDRLLARACEDGWTDDGRGHWTHPKHSDDGNWKSEDDLVELYDHAEADEDESPSLQTIGYVCKCRICGETAKGTYDMLISQSLQEAEVAIHEQVEADGWIDARCSGCVAQMAKEHEEAARENAAYDLHRDENSDH